MVEIQSVKIPEIPGTAEIKSIQDALPDISAVVDKIKSLIQRILYVPTNICANLNKICEKYPWIRAVIIDNEDAAPSTSAKNEGRKHLVQNADSINALRENKEIIWGYRINKPLLRPAAESAAEDQGTEDIKTVIKFKPDFIVLPKVNNHEELSKITKLFEEHEKDDAETFFFLIIESLEAASNLEELIKHPRVIGAVAGAQDFGLSLLKSLYNQARETKKLFTTDEISELFTEKFKELEENILKTAVKHGKIPLAPSSFTSCEKTSQEDYRYLITTGYAGRTAINPAQLPSPNNAFDPDFKPNQKRERFFPQLPPDVLMRYVQLAAESEKPGYFVADKENKDETMPNQFGKPVMETMYLMLLFHLAQFKKQGKCEEAKKIETVLAKAKERLGYKYDYLAV